MAHQKKKQLSVENNLKDAFEDYVKVFRHVMSEVKHYSVTRFSENFFSAYSINNHECSCVFSTEKQHMFQVEVKILSFVRYIRMNMNDHVKQAGKIVRLPSLIDFMSNDIGKALEEIFQEINSSGIENAEQENNTTCECGYVPNRVESHTVNITYSDAHIPQSPFPVAVGPYKDSRIRAYGPGLEGGVVGYPADFVVETHGETGLLGDISFSIEGPSQARVECSDNGDGTANARYWPTTPGAYAVHILCNDKDIPLSPFMAWIEASGNFEPNKVKAYGPGIEPSGQTIDNPTEFTIDAYNAGEAPLRVQAIDQEYQPVDVQVRNNGNGTYTCRYTPRKPLRHFISVDYGGVAIPNSPFRVNY